MTKKKSGKKKSKLASHMRKHVRIYSAVAFTMGLLIIGVLPISHTSTEAYSIPFQIQYVQSSKIELGESQINQEGIDGQGHTETKLVAPIFAYLIGRSRDIKYSIEKIPETTQPPTSKIIANGTKKYQYMWCSSNNWYYYYTNEQFKNAFTGFTHKSPDACAQNNKGHVTQLSDAAPQATTYKKPPVYFAPSNTTYIPPQLLSLDI